MIDVCVRQHDGIQLFDRVWQLSILLSGFLASSLKHPAVERDRIAVDVEQMTRAGDLTRGSDKRYLQTAILLLLHHAERAGSPVARPAT